MSIYSKFWVLQNSDQIIDSLNEINKKKRTKSIATYDFPTLYTKLPHDKLVDKLSSIIDLAFKGGNKSYFRLPANGKAFGGKKSNFLFSIFLQKIATSTLAKLQ